MGVLANGYVAEGGPTAYDSTASIPAPLPHPTTPEEFRTVMLARHRERLPKVEQNIAHTEHECRAQRSASEACALLKQAASNACAECLRRTGLQKKDLIRSGPFEVQCSEG